LPPVGCPPILHVPGERDEWAELWGERHFKRVFSEREGTPPYCDGHNGANQENDRADTKGRKQFLKGETTARRRHKQHPCPRRERAVMEAIPHRSHSAQAYVLIRVRGAPTGPALALARRLIGKHKTIGEKRGDDEKKQHRPSET